MTYNALTDAPPSFGTQVNLNSAFNRTGIVTDGSTFSSNGGLTGNGNAYSAHALGSLVVYRLALNTSKTVQSLTLSDNADVEILAVALN